MKLLNEICDKMASADSIDKLQTLIQRELEGCVDNIEKDALGNITVQKGKGDKSVRLVCSVTIQQLIVTEVEEKGKVRFRTTKPCPAASLIHCGVRFPSGLNGVICSDKKADEKSEAEDLFIEIGDMSADALNESVKQYDFVSLDSDLKFINNAITGRILSNCLPIYTFLRTIKSSDIHDKCFSFTFMFDSQLPKNLLKTEDVSYLLTLQCGNETKDFSCGKGCGIVLKSQHSVMPPTLKEQILNTIKEHDCGYQLVVSHENICTLDGLSLAYNGALHAGLATPVRGYGTALEIVYEKDIEKTEDLLLKILCQL